VIRPKSKQWTTDVLSSEDGVDINPSVISYIWCRVRGIRTAGRLGLRFLERKRLRIVWSETFTPAAVRNSCDNVQALSVRFLKLRVLMKLSWRCVVTLGPPDLVLSHTDLVALKRLKSLAIVLGATPNVSVTFLQDKPDCNIPRALFLALLLRDRLLPISFNYSKSILNRKLDELKHFARAN
jgi:hypothetical protein